MKNKKILIIVGVIVIIGVGLFLSTGRARTDVYLKDFELFDDGKTMILKVGVSSSSGYVRKMKRTGGGTNGYYTFYSTFGINSKLGAKDTFEIELDENMDEIYFYTGNKGYRLELIKSSDTQEWVKLNYEENQTFKLKLTDKENVVKIGINTGKQENNYFEYSDKDTLETIYMIFERLKTETVNKSYNPTEYEEIYAIMFYGNDHKNALIDTYIEVYKKKGKYYAEQRYNGIYEITEEDFNVIKSYINSEISEDEKATIDEIALKTEMNLTSHGSNSKEFVEYKAYVKNNKLYAKNLKTNEEKVIFDKEPVKNIAIRSICCAANGYLLILTMNGNVYMSENDCNYDFSFDFPFNKIATTDIVSFKLIPATDYDAVKNLYGVDSKGKEVLLHKMS